MISAESESENFLKIGQHLLKLWAIKCRSFFMKHSVYLRNYQFSNHFCYTNMQGWYTR